MQFPGEVSDEELVTLLRAGNQNAYTEIYNRYKGVLLIHAYKKLGSFEEAKDIVQDMFSWLWSERKNFPETQNISGYLYTIVRNRVLNAIEHKKVISKYAESFATFAKEHENVTDLVVDEAEMRRLIDREIEALPPKMKEVFILSRRGQLSYKEIAEHLDISEFTVKNHIKAALKILRVKLGLVAFLFLIHI